MDEEVKENAKNLSRPAPTYDPTKSYQWSPNDPVPMTGVEFANILNSLRAILNTPETQRIMLTQRAAEKVENVLAKMVELGIAKEQESKK